MKKFLKSYGFIVFMLAGIIAGCIVGILVPQQTQEVEVITQQEQVIQVQDAVTGELYETTVLVDVVTKEEVVVSAGAKALEPLGTIFINLMFCVVVPMVFCSIASAIANMQSMKKAGKVMGVTLGTFFVTAAIAALIMYVVARIFPLVSGSYEATEGEVGSTLGVADMIINFFTKPDFAELLSRRAILPLIVFAILFGFGVQMAGGKETLVAKFLANATDVLLNMVKIISYYAPIGFFGFFASLVATYGPELIGDYSRTLIVYYVLC